MSETTDYPSVLTLTSKIVAAFVGNNTLPTSDLQPLIANVFEALSRAGEVEEKPAEPLTPAVPIKRSVGQDFLICLEDGKKLKMLKRYLASRYNMTPDDYRRRWGLPAEYPMVAPGYAAQRSALAKEIGLGRKPAPAPVVREAAPTPKARRRRAAGRQPAA